MGGCCQMQRGSYFFCFSLLLINLHCVWGQRKGGRGILCVTHHLRRCPPQASGHMMDTARPQTPSGRHQSSSECCPCLVMASCHWRTQGMEKFFIISVISSYHPFHYQCILPSLSTALSPNHPHHYCYKLSSLSPSLLSYCFPIDKVRSRNGLCKNQVLNMPLEWVTKQTNIT